jgi:hypothetical protein
MIEFGVKWMQWAQQVEMEIKNSLKCSSPAPGICQVRRRFQIQVGSWKVQDKIQELVNPNCHLETASHW